MHTSLLSQNPGLRRSIPYSGNFIRSRAARGGNRRFRGESQANSWENGGADTVCRDREPAVVEPEHSAARKKAREADQRFIAAAENGLDVFYLFDAVRGQHGKIVDFRFRYVNAKAEELLGRTREQLVGQLVNGVLPVAFDKRLDRYCEVVETGHPLDFEVSVMDERIHATWLRLRAVKLGDGVAVTAINLSQTKEAERRYEGIASFSDSIFESAPFSIIATDLDGLITAMNPAAEKLSGYSRADLTGKALLTVLHDDSELRLRGQELAAAGSMPVEGFAVLAMKPSQDEMEEREWTYIRKDGKRTPVSLALRAIRSSAGEMEGYVGIASDITDRRQILTYVTHLATHDPLTGLAGRTVLHDKLNEAVERAKQNGKKVAVFVLDLDNFKRVNDSLGHKAGDQVIREAAQQLRAAVRATDTVGRMGGDEFVVILPDIQSIGDIDGFARNLVQRIGKTMIVNHYELNVTASIGVCVFPDFASNADSLLERADAAMYESKLNGRDQHQIFNAAMMKETTNRLTLEQELRQGLKNEASGVRPARCASGAARWWGWRRCCGGTVRGWAKFLRRNLSRWRKRPGSSCRLESGCCGRRAWKASR